jgi:hypothetical protein
VTCGWTGAHRLRTLIQTGSCYRVMSCGNFCRIISIWRHVIRRLLPALEVGLRLSILAISGLGLHRYRQPGIEQ